LPYDLQALLEEFVPEPPELKAAGKDMLPAEVRRPHVDLGSSYWKPNLEESAADRADDHPASRGHTE
jgi:hypothetical protein